MTDPQLPPHNLEAEQAVLGSILIDPAAYYETSDILQPADFYRAHYGKVYGVIGRLLESDTAVDVITVAETIAGTDGVNRQVADLMTLLNVVPTSVNARAYARIVRAESQRRRLIERAGQIAKLGWDESKAIDGVLEEAEQLLFQVTDSVASEGMKDIRSLVRALIDRTEQRYDQGAPVVGIRTGFSDIDRLLEGLEGGDLILIAARPGMGKTSMGLGIGDYAACQGKRVAFFSLEMSAEQVTQRMVSMRTKIDYRRIRRGGLHETEWPIFLEEAGRLSQLPLHINDTPMISTTQMAAHCRRLTAQHGLDLVIVDYIGLMTSDRFRDNRVQEVSAISQRLKGLARNLDIPVIALSQLSRAVESRQDKRPQLSDLRDSGSLEQDASTVLFIYRDQYYYPDTTERPNIAEINIAKNRNGPTGVVDLYWHGPATRFADLVSKRLQL